MSQIRILLVALLISVLLLLCGCDNSKTFIESNMNSPSFDTTEVTSVHTNIIEKKSNDKSGDDVSMNTTYTIFPKEAENALYEYLKCDSIDTLSDSLFPSSVAGEMKNGNIIQGNYFFAGFPSSKYEDAEISECTQITKQKAENLAAFWSLGASLQGISADFSAEEGYEVVVSATYTLEDSIENMKFRVTNRLDILKIINDRWIIVPSSDMETHNMEIIE